jgi:hypothetical protein
MTEINNYTTQDADAIEVRVKAAQARIASGTPSAGDLDFVSSHAGIPAVLRMKGVAQDRLQRRSNLVITPDTDNNP